MPGLPPGMPDMSSFMNDPAMAGMAQQAMNGGLNPDMMTGMMNNPKMMQMYKRPFHWFMSVIPGHLVPRYYRRAQSVMQDPAMMSNIMGMMGGAGGGGGAGGMPDLSALAGMMGGGGTFYL